MNTKTGKKGLAKFYFSKKDSLKDFLFPQHSINPIERTAFFYYSITPCMRADTHRQAILHHSKFRNLLTFHRIFIKLYPFLKLEKRFWEQRIQ
ncbi:MAG: hypothetical protein GTO45_14195 [Candidatus Aminicenantes bacterium]|nr:hypothetical protein [Candidatus Aminicenantes bacterium]NIM79917.1 hypothetical protein [Candidatus Aminicenantes bacterium]NIN19256.1 hypothetical protein [Candidatus Aminicenantes bacterium]NIN43159.1 hypothetical protein [Candidatus Aminicenantes bacterium]NIN85898.1 hypothetical protein [Candidatus Aminicenantes bacterium]